MSTDLTVLPASPLAASSAAANFLPLMTLQEAKGRRDLFVQFVKEIMVDGVDYGTVPGSAKPTLMKPGAEKLSTLFGLVPTFELVERTEDWTGKDHGGEPFFYYFYKCRLWRGRDHCQGEGDGSCNSMESKYRYRWVPAHEIPVALDKAALKTRGGRRSEFAFAIDKGETGGQYGKPAEYWQAFRDGIANGTATAVKKKTSRGKDMDGWEIDSTLYRVPNDDVADQVNTIQKMAQKRAYVAATLVAVNASEFFTQDIEEMDGGGGGDDGIGRSAPMPGHSAPAPEPAPAGDAPPPATEHASSAPSPAAATPTEKQLEKSIEEQGKALFFAVCKFALKEDVQDFLRKTLCTADLNSVDAFSKVEKLKLAMAEEARAVGAGTKLVAGMAGDYRRQVAAEAAKATAAEKASDFVDGIGDGPATPEVLPPSAPVPPSSAQGAYGELTMRYMTICKRVGMKDGLKIVNGYLQQQVGAFDVTTCKEEARRAQYAAIFEALERMDSRALRAFLLEPAAPTGGAE